MSALAEALCLDDTATDFVLELAGHGPRASAPSTPDLLPRGIAALVLAWHDSPSFVVGRTGTVLAAHPAAETVNPACRVGQNMFRRAFEDPDLRDQFVAWDDYAAILVAGMRSFVQTHVDDPEMAELVTLLSRSPRFRELWQRHEVAPPASGVTAFQHPVMGRLILTTNTLRLPGRAGLTLVVYQAEPGSPYALPLQRLIEATQSR